MQLLKKAEEKKITLPGEMMERFLKEGSDALYFFYGFLQPTPGTHTLQLTYAFLKQFRPE